MSLLPKHNRRTIGTLCFTVLMAVYAGTTSAQVLAPQGARAFRVPAANDKTGSSLRAYQQDLRSYYGGQDRDVPLEVKAEYFEWMIWNYCQAPTQQVHSLVILPANAGEPVEFSYGSDTSTWNGSLLAALSYKYAVTRDPAVLKHIARLLEGLHFFMEVTQKPGLACRCVIQSEQPVHDCKRKYVAPDGTVYHFHSDAAKGTYNQLLLGYATLWMNAFADLPPEAQNRARQDCIALVRHVIDHDYHLTERGGKRTQYGNLTPIFSSVGVPFNAQVAYMIVATGLAYAKGTPHQERIRKEFRYLRGKHHVYYEKPLRSLIFPQRVGANPLVKGMNDRNHVLNAAFIGLNLELYEAAQDNRPAEREFLYQLGRTMYWTMNYIEEDRNSLCNFMWTGLLADPGTLHTIVPDRQQQTQRQLIKVLNDGVEQLVRFPLERGARPGEWVHTRQPVWVDQQRPDPYQWKASHRRVWRSDQPPGRRVWCAIDYLHAYWLFRRYGLDSSPLLRPDYQPLLVRGRRSGPAETQPVKPR